MSNSVLDKKYIVDSYNEINNKISELETARKQIGEYISDMQINKQVIAGTTYNDSLGEDDIRLDTDKLPVLKKMINDDLDNVDHLIYKVQNLGRECNGTSDSEIKEIAESLYETEKKLTSMKSERESAAKYIETYLKSLNDIDARENSYNHNINSFNANDGSSKRNVPSTESGGSGGNSGSGGSGGGGKKPTTPKTSTQTSTPTPTSTKSNSVTQSNQEYVPPTYIVEKDIQSAGDKQFNMVLDNSKNVATALSGIIFNGKQLGDKIYNMGNKTYSIDGIYDLSPQRLSAAIDAVEFDIQGISNTIQSYMKENEALEKENDAILATPEYVTVKRGGTVVTVKNPNRAILAKNQRRIASNNTRINTLEHMKQERLELVKELTNYYNALIKAEQKNSKLFSDPIPLNCELGQKIKGSDGSVAIVKGIKEIKDSFGNIVGKELELKYKSSITGKISNVHIQLYDKDNVGAKVSFADETLTHPNNPKSGESMQSCVNNNLDLTILGLTNFGTNVPFIVNDGVIVEVPNKQPYNFQYASGFDKDGNYVTVPQGQFWTNGGYDRDAINKFIEDNGIVSLQSTFPPVMNNGEAYSGPTAGNAGKENPRTFNGQLNTGDYLSIVVDGRTTSSAGFVLDDGKGHSDGANFVTEILNPILGSNTDTGTHVDILTNDDGGNSSNMGAVVDDKVYYRSHNFESGSVTNYHITQVGNTGNYERNTPSHLTFYLLEE